MRWYERRPERLDVEIAVIKECYPGARIIKEKGRIIVHCRFSGRKQSYLAKVEYPDDFPWARPIVWIIEPRIKNAHHQWNDDKSLCVFGNRDDTSISGKIVLDRTKLWLEYYENWLDTGRWPDL